MSKPGQTIDSENSHIERPIFWYCIYVQLLPTRNSLMFSLGGLMSVWSGFVHDYIGLKVFPLP